MIRVSPQQEAVDALLEGLNPPQRDAVTAGPGPLLILAGAGSGKTRVLTHRIAYLLRTGQARADEILAITFTNKAAQEMRERVELLVGRATRAMWVMTFHSACARMLRADAHRLGYTRQFTIYDAADSRRLIKKCIDDLDIDPKRFTPRAMQVQISDAKNKLRAADDYRQLVGSFFEQTVADVYEAYQRELHRANAMDFDDLLFRAVNLLELFQEVRDRYSNAFRWILVDEYQDTNHAQYRWLQLLSSEHRNLAVVGDDDQSIYQFRGADVTNILEFEDDYVDAHVVKLEQNYRSTQTILSAANAVVANNRGRKAKSLWTEIGEGDPIKVRELADEHAEARFVAAEIERLVDEGVSRSELAVFYRTNAMSRVLEDMLVRAQIGYQVIGGTKFYERAEVKDAVAYLTFLLNPADGGAFTRIANSPKRGIGQTSLSRVLAHAETMEITPWDAAAAPESVPTLGTAAHRALGRFMSTMERLKERVDSGAPVAEVVEETLRETGYLDALEAERTIEAQGRIENLEEFVRVAREYDGVGGTGEDAGVAEFLQQIALIADADTLRDDEGLVTLMTLHNAKGLEFPIVFMIGCEDGVFPHSRALDEGSLEEERRLAYVGITRAMRDLYMTYARRRNAFGAESFGVRSRFIDEIPRELTDQPDRNAVGIGRPAGAGRVASWSTAAAASQEALGDAGGRPGRPGVPDGRRRHSCRVRRRRRTRRRARRDRHGPVRVGRLPAQVDGRLRPDPQALGGRGGQVLDRRHRRAGDRLDAHRAPAAGRDDQRGEEAEPGARLYRHEIVRAWLVDDPVEDQQRGEQARDRGEDAERDRDRRAAPRRLREDEGERHERKEGEHHVEHPECLPGGHLEAPGGVPMQEHRGEQRDAARAGDPLAVAQSPHQAGAPAAARAACSVLRSSIAIVIGPTPRGTGVISAARSAAASKSTSPTSPSSVRLIPTSITVAPGLTQSPCTIRGRPTAATRTSARRHTAGRSRVREWHIVTVALRASSICATGLPTRSERPTTTASAPSSSTPYRSSSSMHPAGVHGRSPGRPFASSPAETGVSPSTSLPGSISHVRPLPSMCAGVGSWSRIPDTRGSPLSSARSASTSSCGVSAASRWSKPCMPTSCVAFCFPPT